jgi:hypothetical protein
MDYRAGSHSRYELKIHVVWITRAAAASTAKAFYAAMSHLAAGTILGVDVVARNGLSWGISPAFKLGCH